MVVPLRIQPFYEFWKGFLHDPFSVRLLVYVLRSHDRLITAAPHQQTGMMSKPSYQDLRFFHTFFLIGFIIRIGAVSHEEFLPDQDASPVRFLIESVRQRNPLSPYPECIHIGILHHIQNPGGPLRLIAVSIPLHGIHAAAP